MAVVALSRVGAVGVSGWAGKFADAVLTRLDATQSFAISNFLGIGFDVTSCLAAGDVEPVGRKLYKDTGGIALAAVHYCSSALHIRQPTTTTVHRPSLISTLRIDPAHPQTTA